MNSIINGKLLLFSFLCIGFLAGCGGSVEDAKMYGSASGKITVNGTALSHGRVAFTSSTTGAGAFGDLSDDGSYTLNGEIPVGDYKVFIAKPGIGNALATEKVNPELNKPLKGVAKKYQSEKTTDKTAAVKEGSNTFNFDLTK